MSTEKSEKKSSNSFDSSSSKPSDEYCYRELRFTKAQLLTITRELNLPVTMTLDNRTVVFTEYAFCLLLYRLHYPCTLCGMQETFGRDYTTLSRINNYRILN